jgi:hypothetical protein
MAGMVPEEDLQARIDAVAAGPAEVQGDSGRVKQQPLPDLLQVDHHEAGKRAAKRRGFGLRFARITPGGA